ncbi:MAG: hypothetical protein O7D91_12445 [Planctomycetota bacterium]|nr:hypothetical protein [Planctomycetota bacterium]
MKQAARSLIVTLVLASGTLAGDDPYLRYATGWPDNVAWVDGAAHMDGWDQSQSTWGISAFELTITEPTMITGMKAWEGRQEMIRVPRQS